MTNNNEIPDWAWDFYQAKQKEAFTYPADATEEILNYLGRLFTVGDIPESLPTLEQRLDNYLAGYRQKMRRRLHLLENNAEVLSPYVSTANEIWDGMDAVRRNVTLLQWNLLVGLANGHSYRRLSAECQMSVASAKSAVCRIRKRLCAQAFAE